MQRRLLLAVAICGLIVAASGPASAQTLTGTNDGASETFLVTLEDPGQARFTLTWDDASTQLALAVGCSDGAGGMIIFGTAIAGQDRIATLDTGINPGTACVASVDLVDGVGADFALNLQVTDPNGFVLEESRIAPATAATDLGVDARRLSDALRERAAALSLSLRREGDS